MVGIHIHLLPVFKAPKTAKGNAAAKNVVAGKNLPYTLKSRGELPAPCMSPFFNR